MKKLTAFILVLALSAALLIGCAAPAPTAHEKHIHPETLVEIQPEVLAGGVLRLKINPEIAVHYDENGKVVKLEGLNPEGVQLVEGFTGYEGKETALVLEELVDIIGKAGYFVEEADGKARKIVLELDPGSQVPHEQFLQDMAEHVKFCVESKNWVGEKEFDYPQEPLPTEAAPSVSQQTPAATKTAKTENSTASVPAGLCPVCADDDCDDGKYCDDADEKTENLREAENRKNGVSCPVCGDYDCDDGKYCDDWDDRHDDHDDDHHDRDDWDD